MVWTEITRPKYCRDGLRYASDTTDEEWAMIAPYMPCKNRRGRPRVTAMRRLVNAIFFIAQSGCQWRLLPKEFPPYTTVQRYFYRWRDDGTWQKINHHLVMMVREADGREASPTAGVIDSQSVKPTEAGGPRGFDAGIIFGDHANARRVRTGCCRASRSAVVAATLIMASARLASTSMTRRKRCATISMDGSPVASRF
ncbi:Transposase and inactivated derivatives-like (plasmid) [Nitrobacter hamburgensis X14]|uniref:Transposase and inactivated derivatives-like n=1 Tax=Nitrobacter hamburgensis (strain DSM 10229 / NCIMB 13809 / X14) TaxID=323097 RepID=Q1QFU7_NITHX|nr:Transposase and inactivated derivatives-like [Nitrobacter hamburgensis X14]